VLTLNACNEKTNNEQETLTKTLILPSPDNLVIPTGEWLVNNEHCPDTLSAKSLSKYSFVENTYIVGSTTNNGIWSSSNSDFIEEVNTFLEDARFQCISNRSEEMRYLKFITKNTEYDFAISNKVIIRRNLDNFDLAVPFIKAYLGKADFTDPFKDNDLPYEPYE
jgi:hypothetical protein